MNLFKLLAQKIGLVVAVLILWILDDLIVVLPDAAVLAIMAAMLKVIGRGDRYNALKEYWLGSNST